MDTLTAEGVLATFRSCAGEPDTIPAGSALEQITFADLGYDSLALIEVVTEIEGRFGVRIPESAIPELTTVGELVDLANESSLSAP